MTVDYRVGDVRQVMATIPDASISLVASSPPFIALRSYLPDDHPLKHAEIGNEPDPATFLDTLLELTAEWGRVLAPWGSIAIELGDTYSGSGGAGGDYGPEGMRAGQQVFSGSAAKRRALGVHDNDRPPRSGRGNGWPRAKSLALIPQLFATSLAYGRNLLTGQPSPAGQWLVRNVIVWARPNPAPGALGDKVRPSTSYITVATRSARRWFDLDAVRTPSVNPIGVGARPTQARVNGADALGSLGPFTKDMQSAGAPPLDCWFDHHDTWTLTTQPSSISIKTTERVPCGPDDGGERTTSPDCPMHGDQAAPAPTAPGDERADASSPHTPRTGSRPEPEPSPAGDCDASTSTHSDQPTATAHSTASSRTDPAPSTSQPCTPSAQTADGTSRTPASRESFDARPDMSESSSGEVCPPADELGTAPHSDDTSDPLSACTCSFHLVKTSVHSHYAMWPAKLAERLILMMCPAEVCNALVCNSCRHVHELGSNALNTFTMGREHIPVSPAVQEELRRLRDVLREPQSVDVQQQMPVHPVGAEARGSAGQFEGRSDQPSRLHPSLETGISGFDNQGLHPGASLRDGTAPRSNAGEVGARSPHQRDQGRQPARESGGGTEPVASWSSDLSALRAGILASLTCPNCDRRGFSVCGEGRRRVTHGAPSPHPEHTRTVMRLNNRCGPPPGPRTSRSVDTLGWSDCGHGNYVPGIVLDPFAGTGTTLAVADLHHRDAIGIDLDERNRDLYPRRRDECARALFDVRPQMAGQLDIFGEPA